MTLDLKTAPLFTSHAVNLGCDPEVFIRKGKEIVGSEKIVPKEGLVVLNTKSKIIRDGVQVELNPEARACRLQIAAHITSCFRVLKEQIKTNQPDLEIDFSRTIKISKKELHSLAPENQILGCSPSKNAYSKRTIIALKNGANYFYRSGGGHIHIGKTGHPLVDKAISDDKILVPLLDIIVGNTCVLLDRDPGNIRRRKTYGRAGEYRTPAHGLEYRTLSNFWLQSYQLTSFVLGLTRETVNLLANSTRSHNYAKEILSRVNRLDVKRAINRNDFNLAMQNFLKIEDIFRGLNLEASVYYDLPLNPRNLDEFKFFVSKGIEYWFKTDPIKHWTSQYGPTSEYGWERFLENTVRAEMRKETAKEKEKELVFA